MKSKLMLIMVFAIFICTVSATCAADANETTIATQEDNQMELTLTEDEIQTNENDNMLTQTEDAEILTSGEGTYSDLRNDINSGGNLTKSHYCYNDGDGGTIEINTPCVINGNGAVIDMTGSNIRTFYVSASGVTIKNLTIINVNYNGVGGAIYFSSSGTVTNCNFNNNKATGNDGYGGAIVMSSGSVSNCNFTGNTADYGGAVYFFSTGTVSNCNFTNNTANRDGGAVYFWAPGTVTNCNFTNNTAKMGNAIYINNKCTISDCDFTNNPITKGAIHSVTGDITLSNNIINVDDVVSDKNFTEIQKLIDQANDGDEITINGLYAGFGIPIRITKSLTLNGQNNTTLDAKKLSKTLYITANNVIIKNIQFTSGYAGYGGAIYFRSTGTVTNCNFTGNTATVDGGGAIWIYSGNVLNCNFVNNKATGRYCYGGAIRMSSGTVSNCNFAGNTADYGGAVQMSSGTVSNCNFTGNTADDGGAIWIYSGNVLNCNFADNFASPGGAIYSNQQYTTADTCIFKRNSGDNVNTVIYPPTLNVDNFTTVYGSGEKLTFNLKTNSSIPVTNGNISISVYFKNGTWFDNYSCLSGEGWIPDLPVGSYIAFFDTEYAEFQEINRTVTITMPNVRYSINVSSVTTNNRTVNITAKSDIPKDILWDGKLLFILLDGTADGMVIEANYSGNGTWWAKYTFADYGDYQINATYVGLDNVTITNATISISKTPTEITIINETVELLVGDSVVTGAKLTPADVGELTFTSSNTTVAKVEDGKIIAVGEGSAIITVSFAGNDDYAAAEDKTINVKVIKYDSKVTIEPINNTVYPNNVTIKYSIENKTNITVTIDGVSDDKIIITNDTITVIGLDAGEYTITILNNESSIYHKSNNTKTFTVNKQATSITSSDVSTTYNMNKDLVITLKDSNGKALSGVKVTVDLNGAKTYATDKNGQIKASTKGLAPKTYTARITFDGNINYEKSAKNVKVTVKKATPKLTAKKKTFKTTTKTKKYTITLKDNTGKAIKKAKVTLKVKGKTYKATTNSKGKAVFKIKNLKKKGTFKATITYKGNKYYNKVSKKANIKVIVTFKTVSKGSKDKSTVKEIQQALKDHGYYLSYKGHYLKVDGKFQSCTVRSVKEFQKDKGLKVTGKVDEKTAKKLGIL